MSENITTKELLFRMEKEFKDDIEKIDAQLDKIWEAIDRLKNRPPIWVTFIFTLMSAVIGYLAK